jgi:hypothetical protein
MRCFLISDTVRAFGMRNQGIRNALFWDLQRKRPITASAKKKEIRSGRRVACCDEMETVRRNRSGGLKTEADRGEETQGSKPHKIAVAETGGVLTMRDFGVLPGPCTKADNCKDIKKKNRIAPPPHELELWAKRD